MAQITKGIVVEKEITDEQLEEKLFEDLSN